MIPPIRNEIESDDRHSLKAGAVEVVDDGGESEARRTGKAAQEAPDDAAEDRQRLNQIRTGGNRRASRALDKLDQHEAALGRFDGQVTDPPDRSEQPLRIVGRALDLHAGALGREIRLETADQPGPGRIDLLDGGKIEDDPPSRFVDDAGDSRLDAGHRVDQPHAADRDARDVADRTTVEGWP